MMKYDSSRTLDENKFLLEQEFENKFDTKSNKEILAKGEEENKKKSEEERAEKIRNTYPNYCRYKDKAFALPKNCDLLDENEKITTKNFCYYSAPRIGQNEKQTVTPLSTTSYYMSTSEKLSNTQGLFVPNNFEILFWDTESIYSFYKTISEKYNEVYKTESEKKELLSNLSKILPIGSIRRIIGGKTYYTYLRRNKAEGLQFSGFFADDGKTPYKSETCEDVRTQYQKFVDDFGFYLQIGGVILTAVSGLFCEGCTLPLTLEILTELGFGAMIAQREFEKGENINAAFSLITGTLPLAKLSKIFRGVKPSAFKEVSEAFIKQGSSKFQDAEDLLYFYDGLSEDGKLLVNQMLRMDDITKTKMIQELKLYLNDDLPKVMFKQLNQTLKSNPNKIINVPFIKRLYVRELGTNGVFLLGGLISNIFFDGKLNTKDREKLDGIYFNCPDELKNELIANVLICGEDVNKFVNSKEIDVLLQASQKRVGKGLNKLWQQGIRDTTVSIKNTYVELEDNQEKAEDLNMEILNNDELLKLKKNGWVPLQEIPSELELPKDFRRINNNYYYKINLPQKEGEKLKGDLENADTLKIN